MIRTVMFAIVAMIAGPTSLPAQQPPPRHHERMPDVKLDGDWNVVYAEMDGKVVDNKKMSKVTIRNNVVTCTQDGRDKTWRLHFGPHHMVRCTEQAPLSEPTEKREQAALHTHHGVYIASHDFFCVALNKGHDRRPTKVASNGSDIDRSDPPPRPDFAPGNMPHGSHFVLILRRVQSNSGAAK